MFVSARSLPIGFCSLIYMETKLKPYLLHTSNAFLREWIIKEVT